MELLYELADSKERSEKNYWKDGVTYSQSDEHWVRLETLMNDRTYGWSQYKWKVERDKIALTFQGILVFTITLLFFYGIGQII